MPGQGADHDFLHIERGLAAETAADIGRDDAQAVAGHVEDFGQDIADDAGHLGRGVQRQRSRAPVVLGEIGPVLHRDRGLAPKPEAPSHLDDRLGHHRLDVTARELPERQHVRRGLVMETRRVRRGGGLGIDERVQRVEGDIDIRQRVLGAVAVVGHHGDHGLADVAHPADRERGQPRRLIVLHARGRLDRIGHVREIRAGDDRNHARHRGSGPGIYARDPRMGVIAAAERDVEKAGNMAVVDIGPLTGQQTRVLAALHPRAHEPRPHAGGGVGRGHGRGSSPSPRRTCRRSCGLPAA